jgi:hypothetical protein
VVEDVRSSNQVIIYMSILSPSRFDSPQNNMHECCTHRKKNLPLSFIKFLKDKSLATPTLSL